MELKVLIEKSDNWYVATVPSLPGCVSQGKSEEEAKHNVKEAIELHLSSLIKEGMPLKLPKGVKETSVAVTV